MTTNGSRRRAQVKGGKDGRRASPHSNFQSSWLQPLGGGSARASFFFFYLGRGAFFFFLSRQCAHKEARRQEQEEERVTPSSKVPTAKSRQQSPRDYAENEKK